MTTNGLGGRRVAITGLGVKTPAGLDVDTFWKTLLAGKATAGPVGSFDVPGHPVAYACEIPDFDPAPYQGPKAARRTDRVAQLGLGAAVDALSGAGDPAADPARCAVVVGTGIGGLNTLENQVTLAIDKGPARVSPFLVPMMMPNATPALIGLELGWTGPNLSVATACAAGANAIGEAARMIRWGDADVAVAGGAEAAITPVATAAFARMGALSSNPDPTAASRPFDVDRDGFVMGEGAGFLVLEEWDRARARGANVLGELVGYGRTCDAHHITAPAPGGAGAIACMQAALADADLSPDDVGHVNAHGTSTPLNDAAEAEAITKVFGAGGVPVTSTKGVTGHLIGGAGAIEAVAALMAARTGRVPPTANHVRTEDGLTVAIVSGEPGASTAPVALSNSFGFGGHNATLVLAAA
jgi:3-oxoacyl-[acyl-carrier-protein] synthase II